MLIFGLGVFFRTIAQGVFHCQRCGGDRQYRHRSGRRFFTLFFIPVIPLNKVGEHIQCRTCGARYHLDVLRLPTTAQMQQALPAGMRAAAAAMLRAGDPVSGAARQRAVEAIAGSGAPGYNGAALDADVARPAADAAGDLALLAVQLAVPAREWFLAEVVRIGMADGPLTDAEREAAHQAGAALGMSQAQIVGVIALTEAAAAPE